MLRGAQPPALQSRNQFKPSAKPAGCLLHCLQGVLLSVRVDIRDMVVHSCAHGRGRVGAAYHLHVTRKAGGRCCELRLLGVFGISGGQISSYKGVSRVVSGSPEDEQLATLLPASP